MSSSAISQSAPSTSILIEDVPVRPRAATDGDKVVEAPRRGFRLLQFARHAEDTEDTPLQGDGNRRRHSWTVGSAPLFFRALAELFPQRSGVEATFWCDICLSHERESEAWRVAPCGHAFCRSCLAGYLANRCHDGQVDVRCPHVSEIDDSLCNNFIAAEEIAILLAGDQAATAKFMRFTAMKDPLIRSCPRCEFLQRGDPQVPRMQCEGCHHVYCFHHSDAHPPNQSCARYEQRLRVRDRESIAFVKQTSKKCPGCGAPTFKYTGCNHMTCRCGEDWCWLCGKSILATGDEPLHYDDRNLLSPCAGRQFTDEEVRSSCCCSLLRFLLRLAFAPFLLILWILGLVLYLVLSVVACPIILVRHEFRSKWYCRPRRTVDRIAMYLGMALVLMIGIVVACVASAVITGPWLLSACCVLPFRIHAAVDAEDACDEFLMWLVVPLLPFGLICEYSFGAFRDD